MEEGTVSTDDTAEAVGTESNAVESEETLPIEDSTSAASEGVGEGTAEAGQPETPSFNWAEYGLGRYEGKDIKEVANHIRFMDRQYGSQTKELGELRKIRDEYEQLRRQITGRRAEEQSKPAEINDTELAIFAEEFNRNPYAAMDKYYLPKMTESLTNSIYEKVKDKFGPVMQEQAESLATKQEFNAFVKDHKDWSGYKETMRQLMTDEYLGDQVPYEEAYKLAKLSKDEASLFSVTCELMRKGISFDQAREYAFLKQAASTTAEQKSESIKQEIGAARAGIKSATPKKTVAESGVFTMDDAFA